MIDSNDTCDLIFFGRLFNKEGNLLAYSGCDSVDAAAIASSIWLTYEKYGKAATTESSLDCFFLQCEEGNVIVKRVSCVLLCLLSKTSVPLGTLRAKINALADCLDEPIRKLTQ